MTGLHTCTGYHRGGEIELESGYMSRQLGIALFLAGRDAGAAPPLLSSQDPTPMS